MPNPDLEPPEVDIDYTPVRFMAALEIQWVALFFPSRYNWVDFTFIDLTIEHEQVLNNFNLTIAFMGFKLLLVYTYGDLNELRERLLKSRPMKVNITGGDQ